MANSDRFPYLTSTVLDQDFLDDSFDNLTNQLELIVDVGSPTGVLHLSDRNKYVGGTFYEARLKFPTIERTIGEFLSGTLQFSQLTLEINNADERYNPILPSGASYDGWVGQEIVVQIGLRDVGSTYTQIFRGRVTEQGGFKRSVKSFTLTARNDFERVNVAFPSTVFKSSSYPDIELEYENVLIPIVYGDWTTTIQEGAASIPALPINGNNPNVNGDAGHTALIGCVISENANVLFDPANVFLLRGDSFFKIDVADVVNVNVTNNYFELRQVNTPTPCTTLVEGELYKYQRGEKFYCRVKGKSLGAYDDNIVEQARDILTVYGGLVGADFDSSWNTYRDKASPVESAISTFKSRAWLGDPQEALSYVLSMFEQVRLECFIDRNLKFKITSLHLDDFVASPSFRLKNWDFESASLTPSLDERNNFNRAQGSFNFLPNRKENYEETRIYKNQNAIDQVKKVISKRIVFPNLYEKDVVANQLQEILKVASATIEILTGSLTWRALLLDIGDFVKVNVDIQSTQYVDVPALIRDIGYDPSGMKVPVKLWSFQMLPFPGYNPGYSGTVGGGSALIIEE
jgi:hypothetical protein